MKNTPSKTAMFLEWSFLEIFRKWLGTCKEPGTADFPFFLRHWCFLNKPLNSVWLSTRLNKEKVVQIAPTGIRTSVPLDARPWRDGEALNYSLSPSRANECSLTSETARMPRAMMMSRMQSRGRRRRQRPPPHHRPRALLETWGLRSLTTRIASLLHVVPVKHHTIQSSLYNPTHLHPWFDCYCIILSLVR